MKAKAVPTCAWSPPEPHRGAFWPAFLLLTFSILLFWPTTRFELVGLDDMKYLHVSGARNGVTWAGMEQAFTQRQRDLWFPVLWVSYMIDGTVFGSGPVGFHVTNVLLHAANALLVFFLLRR